MTTIAVAGWVSYYFAQQKATPPQPQAKLTTSEHRAKEEEWNSTLPTKASINTKHTTTMEPVATPDKTKQTTTAAAPVATPDKTRQTATAAPVATPNKTKQTTTTEPVATSDKTRQTAT
ncbi:MAG: hypothetical protein GY814_10200, partial [Gammaproteobacteria bacterium]|nr:hypothetical protein [Gammaproteobacteria bacterium]